MSCDCLTINYSYEILTLLNYEIRNIRLDCSPIEEEIEPRDRILVLSCV